ncbi:MAG: caspase family protein [Saprospiraceae bacterium]|nr:caspase family protein [Saprospiraceae bacterium]
MKGFTIRLLLLVALLASIQSQISAQCLSGNCQNGSGTYRYENGTKYTGQFAYGKPHGQGTMDFPSGNRYTGEWRNGAREGRGKMTFKKEGRTYEGQFKGNRMAGEGTMLYANGDKYTGSWFNDSPNGDGTYYFKSGERYEGNFYNGTFSGNGTMYYPDRSYWTGRWKNSLRDGQGKFVATDGKVTIGTWAADKPVSTRPGGTAAPAPAANNNKPNTGTASSGARPSNTTATPPAGNNNKPTATPAATKPDRNNIAGMRNCGAVYCNVGKGYYDYPDGSRWIGEFKNGVPHGEGVCFYANGDRYEGAWANNAPYGEGVMHYANGRVYGAVWMNGSPVKELDAPEQMPNTPVQVQNSKNVKIWAVIVGVGRYTAMPPLRFTDDDANLMYSFLKSPEGGALPDEQVALLLDEDATRENILRTMRSLFLKADANDVVIFYYSGHGLEGCFLPVDFDGYNNKLRHEEVKQIFLQSKAKHKLCIADACHSGTLNYGLAAKGPVSVTLDRYYQAFEDSDGGIALLMSSKAEELSLEDHGLRQGVFTYYLLRGLKGHADTNGDYLVTIRELYTYVYGKVRDYTSGVQTPVLTGVYDNNMPVAVRRQ